MSAPPPTVNVTICACEEDHVAAITTIYAHHVLHGLASFEIEPPSKNDMGQRRLDIVSRNYPYLVAECDREVVGYAYASPYRLRPAYRQYRRKLGLPPPGMDRSRYRSTADVGAARRMRSKRTAANRGRHRRQRELRLDPSS
jgi:hypothetical protein